MYPSFTHHLPIIYPWKLVIDLSKIPRVSHDPPSVASVARPCPRRTFTKTAWRCLLVAGCVAAVLWRKMVKSRSAKKTHGNIWKNHEKFRESEDFKNLFCMIFWLVVTGTWMDDFPFHIWDVILPIDELIFFKMVKTTNQSWYFYIYIFLMRENGEFTKIVISTSRKAEKHQDLLDKTPRKKNMWVGQTSGMWVGKQWDSSTKIGRS